MDPIPRAIYLDDAQLFRRAFDGYLQIREQNRQATINGYIRNHIPVYRFNDLILEAIRLGSWNIVEEVLATPELREFIIEQPETIDTISRSSAMSLLASQSPEMLLQLIRQHLGDEIFVNLVSAAPTVEDAEKLVVQMGRVGYLTPETAQAIQDYASRYSNDEVNYTDLEYILEAWTQPSS